MEDITYERIKRIINGYENSKKVAVKGIDSNLKYYEIKYIDKAKDDDYYIESELTNYLKELVQLEHMKSFENSKSEILLTDEDVDNLVLNKEKLNNCKNIYLSANALITEEQIAEFEKRNINIQYVPELYFKEELSSINEW